MASLALSAVGGAVGSFWGPVGIGIGIQAGAFIGGFIDRPQQQPRGKLDDLKVTSSGYGSTIALAYGATLCSANIIWSTDLKQGQQTVTQGKGVGQSYDEYTYSVSFAAGVCAGPVGAVGRIWLEDVLVYDPSQSTPSQYDVAVYLGGEGQPQDSLMAAHDGVANTPAYRGLCYVRFGSLPLAKWGNHVPASIQVEVLPGDTRHSVLGWILEDVAVKCGLDADSDVDFSGATDVIDGFVVSQRTSGMSAVQQLLDVFQTDILEAGGKIIALKRGGDVYAHIDDSQLGAREWSSGDSSEPPPRVTTTRSQQLGLPGEIDFAYVDGARRYEQVVQRAVRFVQGDVEEKSTYGTTITMTATDARRAAERLLHTRWLERDSTTVQLGPNYIGIVPATPVSINLSGVSRRMRVVSLDIKPMGEIHVTVVRDDSQYADGLYNSTTPLTVSLRGASGRSSYDVGGGRSTSQTTSAAVAATATMPTSLVFDAWSGVELTDADGSRPGFYVVSDLAGSVYWSADSGTTWSPAGGVSGGSVIGEATTALANGPGTHDTADSSTVAVETRTPGSPSSTTAGGVAAGQNAALVGSEVVSFQTSTPTDATHFALSGLTRGRRSSPQTGHAVGDRFWLLDYTVKRFVVPASAVGATVAVKVVGAGQSLSDVTAVNVVIAANTPPYTTPAAASTLATTAATAAVSASPKKLVMVLCEGFTPTAGDDTAELIVPGSGLVFTLIAVTLRVHAAGGAPSVKVQKSTGTGAFSATDIGTVTLTSGAYEAVQTSSLGTVSSGDKVRFSVLTLATATGWTVTLEGTT